MNALKRVLIIDDDQFMRLGLAGALKQEAFIVQTAEDGQDGFAKAVRFKPDLILCDVMMPILNGIQLKKQLNQYDELAHIPLIFLSGRDRQEDIDLALSLGADGYLLKPIQWDNLLNKIKSILHLHRKEWANE